MPHSFDRFFCAAAPRGSTVLARADHAPSGMVVVTHEWMHDSHPLHRRECVHDYDEILLWIGGAAERRRSDARIRVDIEGEDYLVRGPGSVLIPAGVGHRLPAITRTERPVSLVCVALTAVGGPPDRTA